MKKIFFLALSTVFFVSCSNDDNTTIAIEEASVEEAQRYDDFFTKYSNFTIDGQVISDKTKVKDLLQNAQAINYVPKKKEAHFYTTNEKFEALSDSFRTDLDSYDDKDSVDGFGLVADSEGAAIHKLEEVEDNLAKVDYDGIKGLPNVANNSTYTYFSTRVYLITSFSNGNKYFTRLQRKSDLFPTNMLGVRMASDVRTFNISVQIMLRNLFNTNGTDISIKNDVNSGTRYIHFYENTNYGGAKIIYTLSEDEVHTFSQSEFSNFSLHAPRSLKIFS